VIARELFGRRSIQKRNWSIVSLDKPPEGGEWKLYNLSKDISQSRDLSIEEPKTLSEMIQHWCQYQKDVNVIMPTQRSTY
jgi:hypothetical protein